MNKQFFEECANASLTGSKKFPEVVASLIKSGVESYHVDLYRAENRYYLPSGECMAVANGVALSTPNQEFRADLVEAAVRASQAGKINYPEFMRLAAEAGTVYYIAFLRGKQVTYFGRTGDSHTEFFPGSR